MAGTVQAIFLTARKGAPLVRADEVRAVPGMGLVGDRYGTPPGQAPGQADPARQITLIESEAIEDAARDFDADFSEGRSRRNVVTQGVRLLEFINRTFRVGTVELRGIKECYPCGHLGKLTGCDAIQALEGRGGLRAQILTEGVIRAGDEIVAIGRAE